MSNKTIEPKSAARTVGHFLADNARYLARNCAPDDQAAALAFAKILRTRPEDVLALAAEKPEKVSRRGRPRKARPAAVPHGAGHGHGPRKSA